MQSSIPSPQKSQKRNCEQQCLRLGPSSYSKLLKNSPPYSVRTKNWNGSNALCVKHVRDASSQGFTSKAHSINGVVVNRLCRGRWFPNRIREYRGGVGKQPGRSSESG